MHTGLRRQTQRRMTKDPVNLNPENWVELTTEYNDSRYQIEETLKALDELKLPTIMLWPNADAGSGDLAKGIRNWREIGNSSKIHFLMGGESLT